jgi:hypothetical protein
LSPPLRLSALSKAQCRFVKVVLFFLFVSLSYAHPSRVRYICPDKQKAYEEHCRTQKGYQIPPNNALLRVQPIAPSGSISINKDASSGGKEGPKASSDPAKVLGPIASEDSASEGSASDRKPSVVTTSSSSSSSSIPDRIIITKFSTTGWFWNEKLGWIYISRDTYPYFYSFNDKKWLSLVSLE